MASLRTSGPGTRYPQFPALAYAFRGLASIGRNSVRYIHCHVVRATPMVVNRGRYRDISPPNKAGFFLSAICSRHYLLNIGSPLSSGLWILFRMPCKYAARL